LPGQARQWRARRAIDEKRSRQDRDIQSDGKTDHPFENDEFGVDPRKAIFG
jgi:hypothetical protein